MKSHYANNTSDQVTPLPAQASSGPRGILVEVYSRVVGYFRPVKQWNKGKREEFGERREYRLGGGRFQPNPCEELNKQDQKPTALQAEPGVWREG
jgi:ribonucleoside-triphosphate reductase